MFKSKLLIVTAVIVFIFGLAILDGAIAGEKRQIKSHGASYTTTVNQIEVGDEEGHIILIFENATVFLMKLEVKNLPTEGLVSWISIQTSRQKCI